MKVLTVAFCAAPSLCIADDWRPVVLSDPLTDAPIVVLDRDSAVPIVGPYGQSVSATLVFRCRDNTTSAHIEFGGHFMSSLDGRGRVDYRVGEGAARDVRMTESDDNESLGLWRGRDAIPWIREVAQQEMLLIRATAFDGSVVQAYFTMDGLTNALPALQEACNWQ